MQDIRVVFCFHTHDHEFNFGIGFLSAALSRENIATDLVVYRETQSHSDDPHSVVAGILQKEPSVVAFSIMTFNWHKIKPVISLLRERFDGPVIAGGYHAILSPEEVLAHPGVDAVCTGEGERPLLELMNHLPLSKGRPPVIEGMVFRGQFLPDESQRHRWLVERLEDYPFMDYDIFAVGGGLGQKQLGVLSQGGIFSLPVITGRGCPYRCTYCSNSALIGHYGGVKRFVRRYLPETAVQNIEMLAEKYSPEFFEFMDETFALSKAWVKDFCLHYQREVGLPFMVMSRIDLIDEQTVALLVESGLKLFLFGVESGDERYRVDYLNRKMTNETIVRGAKLLKKYGVLIGTFNIFGMPFETKETMQNTVALNDEIEPDAAIPFIYQPLPGTELAKLAYDNNMVRDHPGDRWDFCVASLDTPELPAEYVVDTANRFRETYANRNIQNILEKLRNSAASSR